jgi:hypothetical protein
MTLCVKAWGWLPTDALMQPIGPVERALAS